MKKTNKFLSLFLAALLVLSYSVLPASAASLKAVTNLKAYNIDDDEINLRWSAVTSADGYQVYIYWQSRKLGLRLFKLDVSRLMS